MICLRCGGELPKGCALTKKYCDQCAVERNRELTRERQRKAVKRMQEVNAERFYNADREYCKPCIYCGIGEYSANLCDYILDTGHRRGCKYGVGCEKRILKEKKNEKSNTLAGNFASMLSRAFQSREPFEESEEENADETDEDNA